MKLKFILFIFTSIFSYQLFASAGSKSTNAQSEETKTQKDKKTENLALFKYSRKIDKNGWGLEVGFGQFSYRESVSRYSVLTPYLFTDANEGVRLNLQLENARFLNTTENYSFLTTTVLVEIDSPIYNQFIYSYYNIGVSVSNIDNKLYDQTLISYPLSIGVNFIASQNKAGSFFVEYRLPIASDFNLDNSTPSQSLLNKVKESAIVSSGLYVGIRLIY